MFDFLWKSRRTGRTQSVVLGDDDEHLMVLPSDTAAWVTAKFNELTGRVDALTVERDSCLRTIRARNAALSAVREAARPYAASEGPEGRLAKRVVSAVNAEIGR